MNLPLRLTLSLLLQLAVLPVSASDFEPCEDDPDIGYYYARVDELLDKSVEGKVVASYTNTSTRFFTEAGVRITRSEGAYIVHHVFLLESLHYRSVADSDLEGVEYKVTTIDIPSKSVSAEVKSELIDATLSVLETEVNQAVESRMISFDGTTYIFRTPSEKCATVWSPPKGSRAANLVSVFEALGGVAHAPIGAPRDRALALVEALVADLQSK